MDKDERLFANLLFEEKKLSDSFAQFNQLQNQMNQKINTSSEWLYKKDKQIAKINDEFQKIKNIIK